MHFAFYILHFLLLTSDTLYIHYSGDKLDYDFKNDIILLTGNATLIYKDVKVFADTIRYEPKKEYIYAYSNAILWVGTQKTESERMRYNLTTGEGISYNARTHIQKGWFEGEIMRKVGEKILNIDYGTFTTCDLPTPHYYFWARELKVYLDDMVIAKPVILCIQDIPVFIIPYWFFPITKKRRSGLLFPKIGTSTSEGRYVKNISYYYVINDYADCTFILDYMEKRGPKFGIEAIYLIRPWVSGNLTASHIIDVIEEKRRWSCNFVHMHNIGRSLSIRAMGNFLSDTQYKTDYEEETLVQLDKRMISNVSITKRWSFGSSGLILEENRDLVTNTYTRLFPQATFTMHNKEFLGAHLSYSNLLVNYGIPDTSYQGFDNRIRLSRPFKVLKFFSLMPSMNYSLTIYDRDKQGKEYPIREFASYSLSFSTIVYGRTFFRKPEFRHILTPRISWSYTPERDFSRFYTFSNIGGAGAGGKAISFSLGNNFQAVFFDKKINIGNLNFSSAWNFEEKRINPVSISLFLTPIPFYDMRASATYNTTTDKIENIGITNNLVILTRQLTGKNLKIKLTHHYTPERDHSMWGNISIPLTKNWDLKAERRWDLKENKVTEESFSLMRDLHCWIAHLGYRKYGNSTRYSFEVKIKEIPEIKVGKGIIGWLLP